MHSSRYQAGNLLVAELLLGGLARHFLAGDI